MELKRVKIGFIPANRNFFSDKLAAKMRAATIEALRPLPLDLVVPSESDTKVGCVENLDEALKVGRMFRQQGVEGVIVGAVNFGDEQAAALALKEMGQKVPILIFGCQEEAVLSLKLDRRDAFCGLLSIGEALRQLDLPYSVPETPICFPSDAGFRRSVENFIAVVRAVGGIRKARYGQIGARPDAFWTCRFNEKSLQTLGPTIVTLDLSEAIAAVNGMATDAGIRETVAELQQQCDTSAVSPQSLEKIAKFERFCLNFVRDKKLDGLGVQCWTSVQNNLGICTCSTMARLDDRCIPSACEADMMGTLSMHALQLASGQASCLADWNNLHNDDADLANCWHCGVFPPSWAKTPIRMGTQGIVADAVGKDAAMGVFHFVMKDGPVTLCRATQDNAGGFKVVLAQGQVEPNPATTFGAYGWVRIKGLNRLYKNVLLRHFPHHVAMNRAVAGNVLWEAFGNYLGFQTYTVDNHTGAWNPELPFEQTRS